MSASPAWRALAARPAVAWTVLCHLQGRQALHGWTNYAAAIYVIAWSPYTHAATLRADQGLYRGLDGVWQGRVPLTARADLSFLYAYEGSYYYDAAAGLLYVRTLFSAPPDTVALLQAVYTYRLGTHAATFATLPPYDAQLTGESLPSLRLEQSDPLLGVNVFPSGDFSTQNADGFWDTLVGDPHLWINNTAQFFVGGDDLAFADYLALPPMQVASLPAAGMTTCTWQLRSISNALNQAFPQSTFGDFWGAAAGALQSVYMHDWWGTVYDVPLISLQDHPGFGLGSGPGGTHEWNALNFLQVWPLANDRFEVLECRAYLRADPTDPGTVVAGSAYSYYGNVAVDPAYPPDTYEIRADLRRKEYAGGPELQTFGAIAKDILRLCDVPLALLEIGAFTDADARAPQRLGLVALGGPTSDAAGLVAGVDLINRMERSVSGSVHQSLAFPFTCAIWTPAIGDVAALETIDEGSRFTYEPESAVQEQLATTIKIRYRPRLGAGTWQDVTSSSTAAVGAQQRAHQIIVDTCLVDDADAATHAAHVRLMSESPTTRVRITGPPALVHAEPWQKFHVTGSRGPSAIGTLDTVFEVVGATTRLVGPSGDLMLANLRGLGTSVRGIAPDGTPNYASASTTEQMSSFFIVDDRTEQAQAGVPASRRAGIIW